MGDVNVPRKLNRQNTIRWLRSVPRLRMFTRKSGKAENCCEMYVLMASAPVRSEPSMASPFTRHSGANTWSATFRFLQRKHGHDCSQASEDVMARTKVMGRAQE